MKHGLCLIASIGAMLIASPTMAAAMDGVYSCRAGGSSAGHSGGALIGTLTIEGDHYRFDGADGTAGEGIFDADGKVLGVLAEGLGITRITFETGSAGDNVGLFTDYSDFSAAGCL